MTKGQRAMAVAIGFPEAKRGMHSQLIKSIGKQDFDKGYLSMACTVLRNSQDCEPTRHSAAVGEEA